MKGYNTDETVEEFIKKHGKLYDAERDNYFREPFAKDTKVGKNSAIYNAHTFHTKVPPEGIIPYIKHYTNPGDLILDPFCGSGMTGVAALITERHSILNDLSPAACHIAYNYCSSVDIPALVKEFNSIMEEIHEEFEWLYGTHHDDRTPATIQYTIWSDVYRCYRCGESFVLWDVAVDQKTYKIHKNFNCPHCQFQGSKAKHSKIDTIPIITNYEYKVYNSNTKKWKKIRAEHRITKEEIDKLKEIDEKEIPYWFPDDDLVPGEDGNRLINKGIHNIHQFYFKRTLWAFSSIWQRIMNIKSKPEQEKMKFIFTSQLLKYSKRAEERPKGPGNSPNLRQPSLIREMNIKVAIERKFKTTVTKLLNSDYFQNKSFTMVQIGSANDLKNIASNSIDYIFADPPFGRNIAYSELNIFWEGWLGRKTDIQNEIITSHSRKGFSTERYEKLMTESFTEMHRVLKPGRWASIIFSNTDDKIWKAIRNAVLNAGFQMEQAKDFDKSHYSQKQIQGRMDNEDVLRRDTVLNLVKEIKKPQLISEIPNLDNTVLSIIKNHLETLPKKIEIDSSQYSDSLRSTDSIYTIVIQELMNQHLSNRGVTMPFINELCSSTMKKVDGKWYLPGEEIRLKGKIFIEVKDERTAIEWLYNQLEERPLSFSELVPEWRKATLKAGKRLEKSLQQLLEENFWHDTDKNRWRLPTSEERLQMGDEKTLEMKRNIRKLMDNKIRDLPSSRELLKWLTFAYQNMGDHKAAIEIFRTLNLADLTEDEKKKADKINKYCMTQITYGDEA